MSTQPLLTSELRTTEALDDLPIGAVIRDSQGRQAVKTLRGTWKYTATYGRAPMYLKPVSVIDAYAPVFLVELPPRLAPGNAKVGAA